MKHNITKSLLALVISLLALPMQSQDYLKIYFKDGHTECHYMHLVESISATKYDLEGNLHSDYQMQQIVMKDATYSYYLSDIDSMSFKKVYEEQVKADVEQVSNTITPIFEQCATIEEMETHIDEMKAMDCVEDVWREGSDIVVQIRDWKKIFYKYPLVSDSDFSQILNSSTRNSENLLPIKSDGTPMKVGIAFQMVDDPRFDDEERALFILSNRFQQLGFDSHYIDVLDFDFFNKDIFNYDILFLATHGSYSKGKHYLYTSIKTDLKDDLLWEIANRELGSVGIDYDDISYSYCQTGEYLINFGTFIVISEDYIRRSQYNFTGPGPHVVFNAACSSLKGGNQLTRENDSETFRGNDSMAKVFFNKGADVYFGETNDSYNSRLAGLNLFYYMLDGASEECAYNQLDPDYKYESDSNDKSALIDLFNPNSKYDIKGLFLNSVQTEEKSVKEINDEYKTNGQIELKGKISPLLDINQGLTFGFRLSSEPDVDTSNEYETIKSTNADYSGRDFGEVTFSAVVDPEPGKTYYYRAYTYDGNNYNYGSPYSFTIKANTDKGCPDNNHPHAIDLGLPSRVKWSCCNVDASSPEDFGGYYAWGEIEEGDPHTAGATNGGYAYGSFYLDKNMNDCYREIIDIGASISGTEYDVASVKWGDGWRMPNKHLIEELIENTTTKWTTKDGVEGIEATSKLNGAKLFLPHSGVMGNDFRLTAYWGSVLDLNARSDKGAATVITFEDGSANISAGSFNRWVLLNVRPVRK